MVLLILIIIKSDILLTFNCICSFIFFSPPITWLVFSVRLSPSSYVKNVVLLLELVECVSNCNICTKNIQKLNSGRCLWWNIVEEFYVGYDANGRQRRSIDSHSDVDINVLPGPVVLLICNLLEFPDCKKVVSIIDNSTDPFPNHISAFDDFKHIVQIAVVRVNFHCKIPSSEIITNPLVPFQEIVLIILSDKTTSMLICLDLLTRDESKFSTEVCLI